MCYDLTNCVYVITVNVCNMLQKVMVYFINFYFSSLFNCYVLDVLLKKIPFIVFYICFNDFISKEGVSGISILKRNGFQIRFPL